MFYLTSHSTYLRFIWRQTYGKGPVREETCCCHMGYSFRLVARVLLYAPIHRQDNTYHSHVAPVVELWLEREIAQWVHHKGSIRRTMSECSHHRATSRSYAHIRQALYHASICTELTFIIIINSALREYFHRDIFSSDCVQSLCEISGLGTLRVQFSNATPIRRSPV